MSLILVNPQTGQQYYATPTNSTEYATGVSWPTICGLGFLFLFFTFWYWRPAYFIDPEDRKSLLYAKMVFVAALIAFLALIAPLLFRATLQ